MNFQELSDRIYYMIFKRYSTSYKKRLNLRYQKIKRRNKFDSADPDYAYFPTLLDSAAKIHAESAFREAVKSGNLDHLYFTNF